MNVRVLLQVFALVFLAELGDKTQLTALGFASQSRSPWSVFIETSLALILSTALAVFLGELLSRILPPKVLHIASAVMFVLIGLLLLVNLARQVPSTRDGDAAPDAAVEPVAGPLGYLSSFVLGQVVQFEDELVTDLLEQAETTKDARLARALRAIAAEHRSHLSRLSGLEDVQETGAAAAAGATPEGAGVESLLTQLKETTTGVDKASLDAVVRRQEAAAEFYIALARLTPIHAVRDILRSLAMEEIRCAERLCDLVNHPAASAVV